MQQMATSGALVEYTGTKPTSTRDKMEEGLITGRYRVIEGIVMLEGWLRKSNKLSLPARQHKAQKICSKIYTISNAHVYNSDCNVTVFKFILLALQHLFTCTKE